MKLNQLFLLGFSSLLLMSQQEPQECIPAYEQEWVDANGGSIRATFVNSGDCQSTSWSVVYTYGDGTEEVIDNESWALQNNGNPSFDFSVPHFNCCTDPGYAGGDGGSGGGPSGGWEGGGTSGGGTGGGSTNDDEGCGCEWDGISGNWNIYCPCVEV